MIIHGSLGGSFDAMGDYPVSAHSTPTRFFRVVGYLTYETTPYRFDEDEVIEMLVVAGSSPSRGGSLSRGQSRKMTSKKTSNNGLFNGERGLFTTTMC